MKRRYPVRRAFGEGAPGLHRHATPSPRWPLIGVILCCLALAAPAQIATEYQVKAAFLYNFAKFVEWPASSFADASAPLKICVLGRDPFGDELRTITVNKSVNGRKLEVDSVANVQHARSCHILFIASSLRIPTKEVIEGLHGANVLTVGDSKGFAEQGGSLISCWKTSGFSLR